MSLQSQLRSLMDQTVTKKAVGSMDMRGAVTFSTAVVTYAARVEGHQQVVVDTAGKEVLARTTVFVGTTTTGGTPAFTTRDRITLPDGTTPPILSVDTVRDENSIHHQVVYCG